MLCEVKRQVWRANALERLTKENQKWVRHIQCFAHNFGFTIKIGKDFNHIVQVSQLLRCNTKVLAFPFCGAETKVEVQV